jgi:hypothetical protein
LNQLESILIHPVTSKSRSNSRKNSTNGLYQLENNSVCRLNGPSKSASQFITHSVMKGNESDYQAVQDTISPKELLCLIEKKEPNHLLLLDIRSRDRFMTEHIDGPAIINIEPMDLRSDKTAMDLESSLETLCGEQVAIMFSKRYLYRYIVYYDENDNLSMTEMNILRRIVCDEVMEKKKFNFLKLKCGYEAWREEYNGKHCAKGEAIDYVSDDWKTSSSEQQDTTWFEDLTRPNQR